jgi:hypothetical protein
MTKINPDTFERFTPILEKWARKKYQWGSRRGQKYRGGLKNKYLNIEKLVDALQIKQLGGRLFYMRWCWKHQKNWYFLDVQNVLPLLVHDLAYRPLAMTPSESCRKCWRRLQSSMYLIYTKNTISQVPIL